MNLPLSPLQPKQGAEESSTQRTGSGRELRPRREALDWGERKKGVEGMGAAEETVGELVK